MIDKLLDFSSKHDLPALVYSEKVIFDNLQAIKIGLQKANCVHEIYYAVKSCYNKNVINFLADQECGFEIMSEMEFELLHSVLNKPCKVILNGIGRSKKLLRMAVENKCKIVVDSLGDLIKLSDISRELKKTINIGLRVRPPIWENEDVSNDSPYKKKCIKLGIVSGSVLFKEMLHIIKENNYLDLTFLHAHFSINEQSSRTTIAMLKEIRMIYEDILNLKVSDKIETIDIGGGFGTFLTESLSEASQMFYEIGLEFDKLFPTLCLTIEPGRYLTNSAGYLIAKVTDTKRDEGTVFVFTSATTNVLIPISTARYKLLYPQYLDNSHSTEYITLADGITSPNNLVEENIPVNSIPLIGDIVIIGNCGAYTSVLQHYWGFDLFPIFYLTLDGSVNEILSTEQILKARRFLLGF